jgi:DNA polymerase III alpha subunit
MTSKPEDLTKTNDEVLYVWYKLELALKEYLTTKVNTLPKWALKRGYSLEELHNIYRERLVYEFNVVKKMGFLGYFLIVSDMLYFCKKSEIPAGPGRGSGAGSFLGFLLNITTIDPIRYDLLFERFLNPERYSMPDYDVDISQSLRHLVKDYFVDKYGSEKVASIGTFSRMKVRAAVKDIARSLNITGNTSETFRLADKISKTLDEEDENITYTDALKNPEFKAYMERFPILAERVKECENILRQMSMHAAAVLISAEPLDQELPLIVDKNGTVVTAYDGKTVEGLGYLKLDALGLKNLDVIATCRQNVEKVRGYVPEMSLDGIEITPNEDPNEIERRISSLQDEPTKLASRAYQYLRTGKSTLGIFQCEQAVTQDLLRKGETNSIEDIADILALIRPGPRKAGSTEIYIARKRKEIPISYLILHEPKNSKMESRWDDLEFLKDLRKEYIYALENGKFREVDSTVRWGVDIQNFDEFLDKAPKLCSWISQIDDRLNNKESDGFNLECMQELCDNTQGLPLFQEQLMKIAMRCAGFTAGESDVLRKAVGKKDQKLIDKVGAKFVQGLVSGNTDLNPSGLAEMAAKFLWYKFILPYGSYGFNLSHSIAYGRITYETAWLKANFPAEFYASLLSYEEDQAKIATIIAEAKLVGIKFELPNVNKSTENFAILDQNTIIYSLTCLKGLGVAAVRKIVEARPYTSMVDFLARSHVNATAVEALIKGGGFNGAFDEKVKPKNYFDFYKDCRMKIKRQLDRLLRDKLIREYGYKWFNLEAKKQARKDNIYITPSEFHEQMLETNDKYRSDYNKQSIEEIKNFQYVWSGPLTESSTGKVSIVPRMSEDDRDEWTKQEIYAFEEQIYGAVLSGHRLDLYIREEQNFIANVQRQQLNYCRFSDDLNLYSSQQEVLIYCRCLTMSRKNPYKSDPTQFIRFFELEDRYGKMKLTVFHKVYEKILKASPMNPLSIASKASLNHLDRPVAVMKCKVNDYMGMRGLVLDSIVEWINEVDTKEQLRAAKIKELKS